MQRREGVSSSSRKRPLFIRQAKCAYPSDGVSVIDMHGMNRNIKGSMGGTPTRSTQLRNLSTATSIEEEDENLTYQKTMQRIVQRYIFDIQREAEVTEDSFDEIKQEIFSIRYDFINHISTKTTPEEDINAAMKAIMRGLQVLKDEQVVTSQQLPRNDDQISSDRPDDNIDTVSRKSQTDIGVPANVDTEEGTCDIAESPDLKTEATMPSEHGAEDLTSNTKQTID